MPQDPRMVMTKGQIVVINPNNPTGALRIAAE